MFNSTLSPASLGHIITDMEINNTKKANRRPYTDCLFLCSSGGFTLMEMLMVVILITILASFGIHNYEKAVQKSYERNAYMSAVGIHQANEIYLHQYGEYLPGNNLDLDDLNTDLNLNFTAPVDVDYNYRRTGPVPGNYILDITWRKGGGGPITFQLRAISAPLDIPGNTNPCCNSPGSCLTLTGSC